MLPEFPTSMSRRSMLMATGVFAAALTVGGRAAEASAAAVSPTVRANRTVTFTLTARSAKSVLVRGGWGPSFGLVDTPMTADPSGTWRVTVGPLAPSYYQYWFVVDGVDTKDPANPSSVHANPALSTFLLPGPGTAFLTAHHVPHGRVAPFSYQSAVTGTRRTATVWTPPGYGRTGAPLPTFYLVHGGGGDYLDWVEPGRAPVILDNLFAAGKLRPMVVVMPDGNVPGATGLPLDDTFPAEILDNLVPAVEQAYRVRRSPRHRALAGLSLGGLQTWNLLLSRPGAMAYIGDFSSGYFPDVLRDLETRHGDLLRNPAINQETRLHRIYIGNPEDIAYTNNVATRALFRAAGIRHEFSEFAAGGHTWQTWRDNLHDFAPRLFR
jgi:enterochelin esterase family protein